MIPLKGNVVQKMHDLLPLYVHFLRKADLWSDQQIQCKPKENRP